MTPLDRTPVRFAGGGGLSAGARRLKEELERARRIERWEFADAPETPRECDGSGDRT